MKDLDQFCWHNPTQFLTGENSLRMTALAHSDFFVDPASGEARLNAAYFYRQTQQDFVLKAMVSHGFWSVYDACALLVMDSDACWAKICFELTDMGTHSVVSMVTDKTSDDANGVDLSGDSVYLQVAKKGDLFGMHYSLDGENFNMVRYFSLPMKGPVKVGFAAQSPVGPGGEFLFEKIQWDFVSVDDVRKGK